MISTPPPLALLAAALSLVQPQPAVPEIAHQLPRTIPPPAWPSGTAPGREPASIGKETPKAPPAEQDKWVEVFPHVRVNRAQKSVEFDGKVPWDFHNPDTPRTELELLVCLPLRDKEHESLVMSEAKGQHVHAAMLMVGFEPGTPGRFDFGEGKDGKTTRYAPVGPYVNVTFHYTKDGKERVDDPRTWFFDEHEAAEREAWEREQEAQRRAPRKGDAEPAQYVPVPFKLVFGGSKVGPMRDENGQKRDVYFADMTGALIGLCTFGSETIGNTMVTSPDSGVDAPRFVAKNDAIPPMDTPVRVRIRAELPSDQVPPNSAAAPAGSNKTPAQAPPQPVPTRP